MSIRESISALPIYSQLRLLVFLSSLLLIPFPLCLPDLSGECCFNLVCLRNQILDLEVLLFGSNSILFLHIVFLLKCLYHVCQISEEFIHCLDGTLNLFALRLVLVVGDRI